MSAEGDNTTQPESQFQKPGDLVERNEDTGVMQVESMCMNCHDNVRFGNDRNRRTSQMTGLTHV